MSDNWIDFMTSFEARWAIAPRCPFCGSSGKTLMSWWERKPTLHKMYKIDCLICGSSGAKGHTPVEAIDNWSSRTDSGYHPLGEHSYMLSGGQKYQHLVVYERGNISLIDYIEDDQIVSQVDVNLGAFRISRWVRGENKGEDDNLLDREEENND